MHNIGTPLFYDTLMDQTFWTYFICFYVWKIQTESGMKSPPIELYLEDISDGDNSFGDSMKFSYQ